MGRLLKNAPAVPNTGAVASTVMPGGTTADRPDAPEDGQVRYNNDLSKIEYWDGIAWRQSSTTGLIPITKDQIIGNGTDTDTVFGMSLTVADETDIIVYVGGVYQNPGVAYTVDGSANITFTSPVPNLEVGVILHGYNSVI